MGIETFFGNLFGIPDVAGNARRDVLATAQRKAGEVGQAPTAAAATDAEKARIRKKTKTILTGPLTGGDYGSAAPTLLGSGDVTKKQVLG